MWKYTNRNDFLLSLHLIDLEDKNQYIRKLYMISNCVERNYRVYSIDKGNGKRRVICEPNSTLKHIQRQILCQVLNDRKISPWATAYYSGSCLRKNALPHVHKRFILKLDIEDFFAHIRFWDVYEHCFPIDYFPKEVGILLTHLCMYDGYLPQGAPTSAFISNLVMREFDQKIGAWCVQRGIAYTRYSDDMTFSGNFFPSDLIVLVKNELKKLGFQLNYSKVRIVSQCHRQVVTGIVVNDKVQVGLSYRKKIRQEMYYIRKFGIISHLDKLGSSMNPDLYLQQLYGRILYVLQINPDDKEFQNYKHYFNS